MQFLCFVGFEANPLLFFKKEKKKKNIHFQVWVIEKTSGHFCLKQLITREMTIKLTYLQIGNKLSEIFGLKHVLGKRQCNQKHNQPKTTKNQDKTRKIKTYCNHWEQDNICMIIKLQTLDCHCIKWQMKNVFNIQWSKIWKTGVFLKCISSFYGNQLSHMNKDCESLHFSF